MTPFELRRAQCVRPLTMHASRLGARNSDIPRLHACPFTVLSPALEPRRGHDGWVAGLRLGILGPLEVWCDGRSVEVPSGRRRRVLAALLTRPGRPVSAEELIEAGWSDDLPADPKAALHTVLSRLRSVLGEQAIVTQPAGYVLDLATEAIDAGQFEALCETARTAAPVEASRLLDEALGLWRGPAYAEFVDLDMVRDEAHRLELERTDVREEGARLALDAGDARDAVRRLESLLADHPFREQAVELLMTALQRCDRTVAALKRYGEHRERMISELGLDPAPSLQMLHRRLLGGGGGGDAVAARAVDADLPAWLDTSAVFLGREVDVERLVDAIATDRVVTVVGPGGVGKSRLVAQTLPTLAAAIGLPATVVELASVEPSAADRAVAEALRPGAARASSRAAVVDLMRAEPRLLVLDSCEHLLPVVAPLAELLAKRCPMARIVVTSRHRLGVAVERVLVLPPLEVPAPGASPEQVRACAAVRLLEDRIGRARSGVALPDEALPAIAAISRHTGGLPLALELAASQCAALGPDVVADLLAHGAASVDDLTVLTDEGDRIERTAEQRSVQGLVDRSCGLLTPAQRELFAALSVFPGRFDLAAVEGLASAAPDLGAPAAMARMLGVLVDASLVADDGEADPYAGADADARTDAGGARYRLLGVLRTESSRRLARSGRADARRRAHAVWVARLTERAARDQTGPDCAAAFRRLDSRRADIVAALRWSLLAEEDELAARIAGAVKLCSHWTPQPDLTDAVVECGEWSASRREPRPLALAAGALALVNRGETGRGAELAATALARDPNPIERYLARLATGIGALYGGEVEEARRAFGEIAEADDISLAYRADGSSSLALVARYNGDPALAREEGRLAVLLAETSGSAVARAFACYAAGEAAADGTERTRLLGRAIELAELVGSAQIDTVARVALLAALARAGRYREASVLAADLVRDSRRAGAWPQFWTIVRVLAEIDAATSRPQEAALLLEAADTHPTAPPPMGDDVQRYARLRADLRARLGVRLADRIRAGAAGASAEQIADRVIGVLDQDPAYEPESVAEQVGSCTAPDGVRTAYAITEGRPGRPLVRAATWLTHLEADRSIYQPWLDSFGRDRPFVRYDLRGCGLSDRDVDDFSLDAEVSDLAAVVDAVGADRVDLLGLSGGGPLAIAYAARHPERVAHLVLYGSHARGREKWEEQPGHAREEADLLVSLTRVGWGRPNPAFRRVFSTLFMPDAATERLAAFEEMQRVSCSPETAARIREASHQVDVADLARSLSVPTLVLHVRDDAISPYDEGRRLAGLIPGAQLITLPGRNHILDAGDPGWPEFVDAILRFLAQDLAQDQAR